MGFKLAEAFVGISLGGLPQLGTALKSARSMFSDAGNAMQGGIDKSMANARQMFAGVGQTMDGVSHVASGLAQSIRGLNQAFKSVAAGGQSMRPAINGLSGIRAMAGLAGNSLHELGAASAGVGPSLNGVAAGGRGLQHVIDTMAGMRGVADGAGGALRGLGTTAAGAWQSVRFGIGAFGGVAQAALHAGRATVMASSMLASAGFKRGLDLTNTRQMFVGVAAGLPQLSKSLKSAVSIFHEAGGQIQGSINKTVASSRQMFVGVGKAASGTGVIASGLMQSVSGLNQAFNGVVATLAGGKGIQPASDGLAGMRGAADGAGAALRGLGTVSAGAWQVVRSGAGALGGVAQAAMHAGRAIVTAGALVGRAGFKQGFDLARSAAGSFAASASASMKSFASVASRSMRAFTTSIHSAVSAAQSAASRMAGSFASSFSSILSHLHPVRLALAGLALTAGAGFMGIKGAAGMESSETAFKTMLGGGDEGAAKAKALMGSVNQFAAATPYELPELTSATRKLLAFGSSAQGVMTDLKMIGDVASGIQAPIGEIAEIYGKARVQGRLFAEDINQLTGRGIPIIQELAKQFGVSESEVKKLIEKGQVGFPELERAFQNMTAEGGKFHGMMDEQSKTAAGLWSTLSDNVKAVARDLGSAMLPAVKAVMGNLISMTGNASGWLEPIKAKIGDVSNTIVANLPAIINGFKAAWTYVSAWGEAQIAFFGAVGRGVRIGISMLGELLPVLGGVGDSFLNLMGNVQFFWNNFETFSALGVEHVRLFASNSGASIKTFFANIGIVLNWLWTNWKNVFKTIWDYTRTVIENLGKNLGEFFVAVKDWMSGKGFNFKWTGLLQGFESSISEMPTLMEAKIKETTPELERLYRELGRDSRKPRGNKGGELSNDLPPGYEPGGEETNKATDTKSSDGKIQHFGLVEFAKHLQEGAKSSKEHEREDREKKMLKAQQQIAKNTSNNARNNNVAVWSE